MRTRAKLRAPTRPGVAATRLSAAILHIDAALRLTEGVDHAGYRETREVLKLVKRHYMEALLDLPEVHTSQAGQGRGGDS
jgi:hypothetical protein